MAAVPCTHALGRFIELGELPRQRDTLGTDNLILVLFKSVGSATDTDLRNCVTYQDMLDAGAVACDFSGYAPKILGTADRTIGTVTGSSPYKGTLTIAKQTWNPAGGVTNNNPVKSALLYRPTTSTAIGLCKALGICDASGAASGGIYEHTFGVMTDQAT